MTVYYNVNCKHNNNGAWCNNDLVSRSLWGMGARICCEYPPDVKKCSLKEEHPRPKPPPRIIAVSK